MKTKVSKWGNSLALRIPRKLADSQGITEGVDIEILEDNGELRLRPLKTREYDLAEILKKVTKDNIHSELSTGKPQGKEVW